MARQVASGRMRGRASNVSPAAKAAAAPSLPGVTLAEPRPQWGWGDAKSPSADAADYNPGTSSAGGFGRGDAAPTMPPKLRHICICSAPQHKVDMLR